MDFKKQLQAGDRRTTGHSDKVVSWIGNDQSRFDTIFNLLNENNPRLRMRTADAIEKAAAQDPRLIQKHRAALLEVISQIPQQEVQWHVAQLIPRLVLNEEETRQAVTVLKKYFKSSESNIVRAFSLEALVQLVQTHDIRALCQSALEDQSPAVRSKAKQGLAKLEKN